MRSHLIVDEHFYGFLRHIKDLCRLWCSTEVFRIKVIPLGVSPAKRVVAVVESVSGPKREFIQILMAALIDQS